MNSPLTALSAIDGRYRRVTEPLSPYFSEMALIHYRIHVEIEYFIALCQWPLPQLEGVTKKQISYLREVVQNFTEQDAEEVKLTERTTNHDVKAVEYFVKRHLDEAGLSEYKSLCILALHRKILTIRPYRL